MKLLTVSVERGIIVFSTTPLNLVKAADEDPRLTIIGRTKRVLLVSPAQIQEIDYTVGGPARVRTVTIDFFGLFNTLWQLQGVTEEPPSPKLPQPGPTPKLPRANPNADLGAATTWALLSWTSTVLWYLYLTT